MRLRLRRGRPTETSRLEAFGDGVFAVTITLLALDLGRIRPQPDAEAATARSSNQRGVAVARPMSLAASIIRAS